MMKKSKRFAALILTGVMAVTTLFGCGSSSGGAASDSSAADSSSKKVLKVGMECAYAPFNWTQDTDTTPDGSKAVKIAGSDYYAYGYDVAVAQKLADQMGMDLEVHKVEWLWWPECSQDAVPTVAAAREDPAQRLDQRFFGTLSSSMRSPSASSPIATETPPAPKSLHFLMIWLWDLPTLAGSLPFVYAIVARV